MRCRLCGTRFDPEELACHTQCPMGARCSLICCPACGFQAVDESKSLLARLLGRLWRPKEPGPRRNVPREGQVTLTHVGSGVSVEVLGLEGMPASRLSMLSAFGLAPGTHVTVVQRKPVPVLAIGHTELALSEEILGQILVRKPRDPSGVH